tara:strand:+ start:257 stop:445 length:189 start_codon:yes stop_codon:yes gene_type:complete
MNLIVQMNLFVIFLTLLKNTGRPQVVIQEQDSIKEIIQTLTKMHNDSWLLNKSVSWQLVFKR